MPLASPVVELVTRTDRSSELGQPTRFEALLLGACARVDRFFLDTFLRRRPIAPAPGLGERLARASAFYGDPRFITSPGEFFLRPGRLATRPIRLSGLPDGELALLRYETDFEPRFEEANDDPGAVGNPHGTALWWRHREAGHPAVLCVHGYSGGNVWVESLAFQALRLYRTGIDVLIYVLPHHGVRTPRGARHSGEPFFDMDLVRTNEAFARAIYELRALLHHLREEGTGPVGAFGMSLGAYTAALLATVEPALAFVAAMIPLVSFVDRWWCEGAGDAWLDMALEHGWTLDGVRTILRVHEPTARPALVPRDRRLVIGARGDAICTPEQAEALWNHWERPRIHWYLGSHLVQLGRRAALDSVIALVHDAGLLERTPATRTVVRRAVAHRPARPSTAWSMTPRRAARATRRTRTGAPRVR
jgi:alpha/beta hydrolase family protein